MHTNYKISFFITHFIKDQGITLLKCIKYAFCIVSSFIEQLLHLSIIISLVSRSHSKSELDEMIQQLNNKLMPENFKSMHLVKWRTYVNLDLKNVKFSSIFS